MIEMNEESSSACLGKLKKKSKSSNFTMIQNSFLQQAKVSAEAKGVLCYLMSLPDDWVVYTNKVAEVMLMEKKRMRRIFNELMAQGYMKRVQLRTKNGDFKGYKTYICDEQIFLKDNEGPEPRAQNGIAVLLPEAQKGTTVPEAVLGNAPKGPLQINTSKKKYLYLNTNKRENARAREASPPLPSPDGSASPQGEAALSRAKKRNISEFPKEFEQFWELYPKRKDKAKAYAKFNELLTQDYNLYKSIIDGLKAQIAERKARVMKGLWNADPKGPAAWLKDRRWEDETATQEQIDEERISNKPTRHESAISKRRLLRRMCEESMQRDIEAHRAQSDKANSITLSPDSYQPSPKQIGCGV